MVNWPAIIKLSDDAELTYVSDQTEWDNDVDLHYYEYDEADYLVDSYGKTYTLNETQSFYIEPEPNGDSKSLQEILGLVKEHASQQGSCCAEKLNAPSIVDALKIVESLSRT